MHQIAFKLGSRPIYWYGIMVATAFLLSMIHWTVLERRENRPKGFASDMAMWVMIGGILGARIVYILGNLPYFIDAPLKMIRIDEGGLVFYGGLMGCVAVVIIMAKRQKEPLWSMADFTVAPLAMGHAIGRVGCFLNGCCYGIETKCPLGIEMQGAVRQPVQLYSVFLNILLYLFLWRIYSHKKRDGAVLMAYCLCYPPIRFLLEFLRGDPRLRFLHLTSAQIMSIFIFLCGIALWKFLPEKLFRKQQTS